MRDYQQECDTAITECQERRCLVKMFCGTGKSKIMSEGNFLAGAKLVVYVFPSLALIYQFTHQYLDKVDVAHLLCVSSEAGATTTPETIQRFFTCDEFTRDNGTGNTRRIVCVTYQSMNTLFKNMGETIVDICCYDEAHHVVAPSYQSHVFSNAAIRKQVFFTATPVNDNGVVMYNPDFLVDSESLESSEKLTCGPLVYEYNYLRGVDEGYLNPFDVRVDFFMASAVDNESFFETDTTASSTLAGKMYESIARAVITSGNTRVLTFHADVNADRDLSVSNFVNEQLVKQAFDHVYRTEFPEILVADRVDGNLRMVALSASMSPRDRAAILAEFDATPDNCVYIVSSCRTIGEGIDTKNANMCVFVDPKSSPLSIIQNIGRIVRKLPGVSKPRSTILIPCAVDREKYTACDTDEKRDVAIRSDLSLPTGNFNGILNVLCALRQEDDELYNACLRSGGGVAGGAGDDDGDSDSDEGGGTDSSEESDRGRSRESSSCTFSVHTDPDVKVLWRLSDVVDLSKTVASAVIDCEVVKYDAMERAHEIVDRANARVAGGGAQLPRHLFKPKNESQEQQMKDAQSLTRFKKTFNAVSHYLDAQLPGWRDNLDEKQIKHARGIVSRAQKRLSAGCNFLPRQIHVYNNPTEKQELMDSGRISKWKMALNGEGRSKCSDALRDFLDVQLPGWRDVRDLEKYAMGQACAIVKRAKERVAGGGAQLPHRLSNPQNSIENQELKDATKLSQWKQALKGHNLGKCPDVVRDFLDAELPGWRDDRDLEETSFQQARAIVVRANARRACGGLLLPRDTETEREEKRDANKLSNWKTALKGKNNQKCSDAVRDFLDAELPGWRDVRDLDENALKEARAIVCRANERLRVGGAQLPRCIKNPKSDAEEQEKIDAKKLWHRSKALKGALHSRCSIAVRDFLDAELPGWRNDLQDNAIHEARAIVDRAQARVLNGGEKLPRFRRISNTTIEQQERKDTAKLGHWKSALNGSKNSVCSDAVRDFLDLELPGWRDDQRKARHQRTKKGVRPVPGAQVATSDPVPPPSSAMVVEPAAPVVVPTKLVTKKRKKTMLLTVSDIALEEGDAKRPARSENPTPSPKSELSVLHQRYKSLTSENLAAEFAAHPAAWHAYHVLSEKNEESFPTDEIPRNVVIRKLAELRTRRAKSVVDLGCGKALIARHFLDDPRFAFTNFDHVACNALVTKCDISLLPLEDDSTEIAILCLAMWGSNCASYVEEAYRVLETHGLLYVVEPTRRWLDESCGGGGVPIHRLRALLETCRFKIVEERIEKFSLFVCCKI